MPTKPLSEERREELRREEWEQREFWAANQAQVRAHELALEDKKLRNAERIADIKYAEATKAKVQLAKQNERLNRLVIRCITLLSLFGRPVPEVLTDLLDK